MEIEAGNLRIPLRYYKGWMMVFNVATETFECPMFSIFGYQSAKGCEAAIDDAIERRSANH